MAGTTPVPNVDSMNVSGNLLVDSLNAKHWEITIRGSQNGTDWQKWEQSAAMNCREILCPLFGADLHRRI